MCVKIPTPAPMPDISPLTLGIGASTPPVGLNPALCCKFSLLNAPSIPIGLPVAAPIANVLTGLISTVLAAIDSIGVPCPLE